jgi:hypothetical protein
MKRTGEKLSLRIYAAIVPVRLCLERVKTDTGTNTWTAFVQAQIWVQG